MLKFQAVYKFLSKLSKREKAVLYAAAFFVLVSLLDRMIIFPIYAKIKSVNNEIRDKETAITTNLHMLSQKDRISSESRKYETYLRQVQTEEEGVTSLLKEIENLANKSSLYIVDMKPGGLKVDKDKIKKYLVNLNCEGEMEQIMDFMYNVENSKDLLTIEKYQISPKSKESSVAQCIITISMMVI
jgi:Tfp pilus assembly protein PilO